MKKYNKLNRDEDNYRVNKLLVLIIAIYINNIIFKIPLLI